MALKPLDPRGAGRDEDFDASGGKGAPGSAAGILQEVSYDLGLGLRLVHTQVKTGGGSEPRHLCLAMNCNQEGAPPIQMGVEALREAKAAASRRKELWTVKNPDSEASVRAEDKLINLLLDTAIVTGAGARASAASMPDDIKGFFTQE